MRTNRGFSRLALLGLLLLAMAGCKALGTTSSRAAAITKPVRSWDELFGITVNPSSGEVYVVGASGLLLTSKDGGKSWHRRRLNEYLPGPELAQDLDLYSIGFDSTGRWGWIVGEVGLILHTEDGGKTWRRQYSPDKQELLWVAVVSRQVVCAVGDHGGIIWSGDGGKTWIRPTVKGVTFKDLSFYHVAFSGEQEGWAVGEFKTVIHSADGGKSWEVQQGGRLKMEELGTPPYLVVAPLSDKEVLVAGQSGVFATTTDGGKNWQEGVLPYGLSAYGATASLERPGELWLAGERGSILSGKPGGEWKLKEPTVQPLAAVVAAKGFGVAVGLGGTIVRTSDGSDWQAVEPK